MSDPSDGQPPRCQANVVVHPISFALEHNGVSFIRALGIENPRAEPLENLVAEFRLEPDLGEPFRLPLPMLEGGRSVTTPPLPYPIRPNYLRQLGEAERATLAWTIFSGEEAVAGGRTPVDALAFNECMVDDAIPGLLASFISPNHPALVGILKGVSDRLKESTGDSSLSGYQSRSPKRVAATASALYSAVQALGVRYLGVPASFETTGQKIRLPHVLLEDGMGCCLDLSVLFCACLEQMGLAPLLVVVPGHAFPAVWLIDERFPEGAVQDGARLRNQIALGHVLAFDSTTCTSDEKPPFEAAIREAERHLSRDLRFALDVRVARQGGFRPLPFVVSNEAASPVPSTFAAVERAEAASRSEGEEDTPSSPANAVAPPAPKVAGRFRRWQERLLDLSLRNRLLNMRVGSGAAEIDVPDLGAFEDLLAGGRPFSLVPAPEQDGLRDRRASVRDLSPERKAFLQADLAKGILHTPYGQDRLLKVGKNMMRTAAVDFEEGGANTLYLVVGVLRWFEYADESDTNEHLAPLLLYPVLLDFDRRRKRFSLRRAPEEPITNLTLVEKARRDFGIDLRPLLSVDVDDSGLDVAAMFRAVRLAIQAQPRWEVLEQAYVGLFSFTKFLMWNDLETNAKTMLENPVVAHIASVEDRTFAETGRAVLPSELGDDSELVDVPCVVDADSTQMSAVLSALHGRSFVLQGPPGTGKSQTITNLIAATIAAGKTVLFVSEKMAALEVVHRRLKSVGLEDFCLEVHSHKSNKKDVLESLEKSLRRTKQTAPADREAHKQDLRTLRARLDDYVRALHRERPLGRTLFEATERLRALDAAPSLDVPVERPEERTAEELSRWKEAAAELATLAARVEPVPANPWRIASPKEWSAGFHDQVTRSIRALLRSLDECERSAASLDRLLGGAIEVSARDRAAIGRVADAAAGGIPSSWVLSADDWRSAATLAREVLATHEKRTALRADLAMRWQDGFFALDLEALRSRFAAVARSNRIVAWFRSRNDRRAVAPVCRVPSFPKNDAVLADLELAAFVKNLDTELARLAPEVRSRLGLPNEPVLDPRAVEAALARGDLVANALQALAAPALRSTLVERLRPLVAGDPAVLESIRTAARELLDRLETHSREETTLRELLGVAAPDWPDAGSPDYATRLRELLRSWEANAQGLRAWCLYTASAAPARGAGLEALVELHAAGEVAAKDLEAGFERSFLEQWTSAVRDQEPELRSFSRDNHDRLIERFRSLDTADLELSRGWVIDRLQQKLPAFGASVPESGEPGILLRETKKKRGHMAVRKLFQTIPNLLPRLKPCLLMSPLSVAQYLPADGRRLDLVVFDEASQIGTHDAIGAIARGNQIVIVGDSKQLPPTTFFMRAGEDDAAVPDDNDVVELESVLDEAVAKAMPEQMLGWHYRSRHHSLIEFSNRNYYDDRLNVFPAARARGEDLGVRWHPVPSGVYLPTSAEENPRTNPVEAKALVDALVLELRRRKPGERTFGVVTFNLPQRELVEDLLDEARAAFPEIESHFQSAEPVFVKNLENVQGDERDEMYFSICYAPDATGRLRMHFGPLSAAGGERRLNVAITRARCQLHVFSTLRPEQIDLQRTNSTGSRHLRDFLAFVERSGGSERQPAAAATDSRPASLVAELRRALVSIGYRVDPNVGCGGYRIDLAVEHPSEPGRYVLGVECDGPPYASAHTARDRDRLRASVLESLGWKLHRVWSAEWWIDREGEIERLRKAVEEAIAAAKDEPPIRPSAATAVPAEAREAPPLLVQPARVLPTSVEDTARPMESARIAGFAAPAEVEPEDEIPPYTPAVLRRCSNDPEQFHDPRSAALIRDQVMEVVRAEAPVHEDRVARAVADAWSVSKVTARFRRTLDPLLIWLDRNGLVQKRGQILWDPKHPRDGYSVFRGPAADNSTRPLDQIAPEEIANALEWILHRSLSLDRQELMRETARVFGISRMGANVVGALAEALLLSNARGRSSCEQERIVAR